MLYQLIFASVYSNSSFIRRALPGIVNLLTQMVKTTALTALIGVVEVVKVAQQIIELHPSASFWIYGAVFVLYFIVCYPLSLLAARLEQQERIPHREQVQ